MADPLEGVLDQLDPNAPPATDPPAADPVPDNNVTIDKDELARLQAVAQQFNEVAPTLEMLRQNPNLIHDLRARMVDTMAPSSQPATAEPDTEFWTNPAQSTAKIAERIAQQQSQATNAQVGQMILNSYKTGKQNSEFYHVCMPAFDRLTQNLNRAQLATTPPDQVQFILDAAWRSAVGEYTERKMAERRKNPPSNLGGGGSAGGGGAATTAKRTLADLNPGLYAQAVQAGLSEEQMQEIVDEIGGND